MRSDANIRYGGRGLIAWPDRGLTTPRKRTAMTGAKGDGSPGGLRKIAVTISHVQRFFEMIAWRPPFADVRLNGANRILRHLAESRNRLVFSSNRRLGEAHEDGGAQLANLLDPDSTKLRFTPLVRFSDARPANTLDQNRCIRVQFSRAGYRVGLRIRHETGSLGVRSSNGKIALIPPLDKQIVVTHLGSPFSPERWASCQTKIWRMVAMAGVI
jgi:hypothetical protein